MIDLEWRTDLNGMILGARVHDGTLTRFELAEAVDTKIEIRRISGELVVFVLSGLGEWSVLELRDGAIVSEVFAWRTSVVPETTWLTGDSGWSALYRGLLPEQDARQRAAQIVRQRPNAWLFQIGFSYGGILAAVCDSITIQEPADG
jgi:hypothetical protein